MIATGRPLLVMTRRIRAHRADVFADICRPSRLARWWDLEHGTLAIRRARVTICERVAPDRIVFFWGGPGSETTTLVTITLHDDGDGTRLVLHQSLVPPRRASAWEPAFDRLRDLLASGALQGAP